MVVPADGVRTHTLARASSPTAIRVVTSDPSAPTSTSAPTTSTPGCHRTCCPAQPLSVSAIACWTAAAAGRSDPSARSNAAWKPVRAYGLLPITLALAGCLLVTSLVDLANGRVGALGEAHHVLDLVAVGETVVAARHCRRSSDDLVPLC
jgi:hypothetical protein